MASATRHRRPADGGRKRAGEPADDDVLRRAALQPHRVDEHVEGDGEGEKRRGHEIDEQPHDGDRAHGQRRAEGRRVAGRNGPRGMGRDRVRAISASMSAS